MQRIRSDVRTVAVAAIVAFLVAGAPALATRAGTAQVRCAPGAVLAFADVFNATLVTSSYTAHGVSPHFNCADSTNRVLVKKSGTGIFFVYFPGISDSSSNGGRMTAAVSTSNAAGRTIGYFNVTDGTQGHVIEVDINRADNGAPDDDGFAITLFGFRKV
jgi:hypothetical protein